MKTTNVDWESHIETLNREATPVRAYAARHSLSLSSLYYWRQKLKAADEAGAHDGGKFIALRVDQPSAGNGVFTVSLGSGVRLEMPTLPPPEWLAALACAAGAR